MATRTLIAALLTGALAAACGATDDPLLTAAQDADMVKAARTAWKCKENDNKDDCSITVTVSDSARGCVLTMEPGQETIAFPRGVQRKIIYWLLDDQTSDGRMIFKQDGIAFKSDASDAFDWKLRFDSGKGFRWRNLNPKPNDYEYGVHVQRLASAVACDLDPKIRNEN